MLQIRNCDFHKEKYMNNLESNCVKPQITEENILYYQFSGHLKNRIYIFKLQLTFTIIFY